ncbi:MAG: MazG nucleotide pyrophosphohydrolase domain-containing protein [Candidatus Aenigmarchaeota archaeon]
MDLQTLLDFIEKEDKYLRQYYPDLNDGGHILARAVKLSEEFGELCNDVLGHANLQRKSKMDGFEKGNINEEFADIIIVALLLAKAMDIDVMAGLKGKIKKIEQRHQDGD